MERKLKADAKGRMAENPVGLHVALNFKGRTFLGEVRGYVYNMTRGSVTLSVRHFNGEMWPIEPVWNLVTVLQ
jgi:hypothetical protein